MRRVLIGDLLAAASVIGAAVDPAQTLQRMLTEADAAHRYAKRFGRPHPHWGNGSLMARAMVAPIAPCDLSSPRLLDALACLCAALSKRKQTHQNA